MEFVCEKKDIQSGVSSVEKIVTTRSTLPIIGYLLFDASKKGLRISANNLEIGIDLGIKAKVSKEGSVLVPAKTLGGIVSKLPDGKVSFKLTEKGTVKISYSQSNLNVHTLPPDEFPVLPKVKEGNSFTIDAAVFSAMIRKTIFAVSTSEDKYVLTGVLLEFGKSSISGDTSNFRMITTDGYRMAKKGGKAKLKDGAKGGVIVPARALQEISRIIELDKGEDEVKVNIAPDQISFKYKEIYLVSRLIQGQFPDYKQVIPKKGNTRISIKTRAFLESAERTAVIASGSANIVRFEIKNKELHLFANTPDVGTVDEVLEAEIKGEGKAQVSFNIRLITDVLKAVGGENVALELTENLGPGAIRAEDDPDYLYIVMPIRTQEVA
jgi:DNA polymerase-3 subunit beta